MVVKEIYLIESESGLVKIGHSQNPKERIYGIRSDNDTDVELRVSVPVPDAKRAEKKLHREFAELRVHGEWFDLGEELTKQLVDRLRELDGVAPDHTLDSSDDLDELDMAILDFLKQGREADAPWGIATPAVVLAALEERGFENLPVRQTINNRMARLELAGHLKNRFDKGEYVFVNDPRDRNEE